MKSGIELSQIVYQHNNDLRNITIVIGTPFYRSTGNNSGFPGTWFPFFGIAAWNGTFVKPSHIREDHISTDLKAKLNEIFGENNDLVQRFGSIPCMFISLNLGGGLWDTSKGAQLKQYLLNLYPGFDKEMPSLSFPKSKPQNFKQMNDVNQWLAQELSVDNIINFMASPHFPILIDTAIERFQLIKDIEDKESLAEEDKISLNNLEEIFDRKETKLRLEAMQEGKRGPKLEEEVNFRLKTDAMIFNHVFKKENNIKKTPEPKEIIGQKLVQSVQHATLVAKQPLQAIVKQNLTSNTQQEQALLDRKLRH